MDRLLRKSNGERVVIAVIPACNECQFISNVVNEAHRYMDKVIAVNDGTPITHWRKPQSVEPSSRGMRERWGSGQP